MIDLKLTPWKHTAFKIDKHLFAVDAHIPKVEGLGYGGIGEVVEVFGFIDFKNGWDGAFAFRIYMGKVEALFIYKAVVLGVLDAYR